MEHNAVADVSLLEDSVQAAMSMQKTYLESPSGTEAYSVMLAQKAGESGLAQKDGESGLYYSTDAVEKAKSEEQAGGGAGEPAAQAEIDDPLVSMVSPADQVRVYAAPHVLQQGSRKRKASTGVCAIHVGESLKN